MGFKNENGEIVGFDIDLAKEVFGIDNVFFQPIDWETKELELASGKIDVIWNGLSKTPEREKSMDLTQSYLKNRQVVIVNASSGINSFADLQDRTVCVQKGSTGSDALENSPIKSQLKRTVELENMVLCLTEIETLKSDATILDETVAKYYLNALEENNFKVLDSEISSEFYVVAVKKGNKDLKNLIETRLAELYRSGKTAEICRKWFGEDIFYWQNDKMEQAQVRAKKINWLTPILQGTTQTLLLFVFVILLSLPLGLLLYVAQNSKISGFFVKILINLLRGTPLLLQLLFVFYGLPYVPVFGAILTIKDRFVAGVVTFSLNYAAYFAEIFRGGFSSIDDGQSEAARALALDKFKTFFKILLPQSLKICLPSICNEAVTLVKDTALVFAIGVPELLANTKNIVNTTANILPYVFAFAIYLAICSALIALFRKIEKVFKF
jgi:polar amino acid transport system substrate-binding protein